MTATRVVLGLSAMVWLPYGVACFLSPDLLAESAGVSAATATGTTELRAMYGGLQAAIGVFALTGALRPALAHPALLALAFLAGGLGVTRLLGVAIDDSGSQYNLGALVFELLTVALCVWLLRRAPATASA